MIYLFPTKIEIIVFSDTLADSSNNIPFPFFCRGIFLELYIPCRNLSISKENSVLWTVNTSACRKNWFVHLNSTMQSPVTFSTSFSLLLLIDRDLCSTLLCVCRSFMPHFTCELAEISFILFTCCFSIFIPNLFVLQIYASPLVPIFLKHLPVALGTPAWYNLHPHIFLLWNYCIDLNWYSNFFSWLRNNLPFIHHNSYSAFQSIWLTNGA